MNIALIGYGAMGRLVEMRARERGHQISVVAIAEVPSLGSLVRQL